MSERHLDAMFAERVLGWKLTPGHEPYWYDAEHNKKWDATFWHPHASLDAAWQGVEKIRFDGWTLKIIVIGEFCEVIADHYQKARHFLRVPVAQTALAIVKACLLATGDTEPQINEAMDKE